MVCDMRDGNKPAVKLIVLELKYYREAAANKY